MPPVRGLDDACPATVSRSPLAEENVRFACQAQVFLFERRVAYGRRTSTIKAKDGGES